MFRSKAFELFYPSKLFIQFIHLNALIHLLSCYPFTAIRQLFTLFTRISMVSGRWLLGSLTIDTAVAGTPIGRLHHSVAELVSDPNSKPFAQIAR